MHSAATFGFVSLYLLSLTKCIEAVKPCKVTNGGAGTCVQISKCQPISDLHDKKHKTEDDHLYLRQSTCGSNQNSKIKVCCPPVSEWRNFETIPVRYPSPPKSKPTPEPSPLPTPDPLPLLIGIVAPTLGTKPAVDVIERDLFSDGNIVSGEAEFCGSDLSSANKIAGGDATAIDQYPWMALLEYAHGDTLCGGSLITTVFVITAAHCVTGSNGKPVAVRLSEYNVTSSPTDYVAVDGGGYDNITVTIIPVYDAIAHPNFDRGLKIHDIAMVKMTKTAIFSDFIKIICLPAKDFTREFTSDTTFNVAGWGDTEDPYDRFKDVKKDVTIPYVTPENCKKIRPSISKDTQICAGGEAGKDTCKGDSGGPLMYLLDETYILLGITSYGHSICGTKGVPAVYVNVYYYKDWITDIIKGKIKL